MRLVAVALAVFAAPTVALADASLPSGAAAPLGETAPGPRCGTARWQRLADAVDEYCRTEADPSEARACRAVRRAFADCADPPSLDTGDPPDTLVSTVPDPRNSQFAWILGFSPTRTGWAIVSFRHVDQGDCDCC